MTRRASRAAEITVRVFGTPVDVWVHQATTLGDVADYALAEVEGPEFPAEGVRMYANGEPVARDALVFPYAASRARLSLA